MVGTARLTLRAGGVTGPEEAVEVEAAAAGGAEVELEAADAAAIGAGATDDGVGATGRRRARFAAALAAATLAARAARRSLALSVAGAALMVTRELARTQRLPTFQSVKRVSRIITTERMGITTASELPANPSGS
jgi:hypothetical protein